MNYSHTESDEVQVLMRLRKVLSIDEGLAPRLGFEPRTSLYHSICCSNNNHMRSELYRGHAGQVQIPVEHIMSPEQRCHCCQTEKRAEWNGLFSPLDFKEKEYDGDESSADRCQPDSNEDIWKSRNIRPIMPASLISPPPISLRSVRTESRSPRRAVPKQ